MLTPGHLFIHPARRARRRGDWAAARRAYGWALRLGAREAGTWMQYGHCAKEAGDPAEALRAYAEAERRRPGLADTALQKGHALKRLARPAEAAEAYREAARRDPASAEARREFLAIAPRAPQADGRPSRLRFINIGTTGLCNASCAHCPTGKAATAAAPRHPMSMALFTRLLDEIHDLMLPIDGQIAFGLFGDALIDPHVVARVRLARQRFPEVPISVNTNGAGFDLRKHAGLRESGVILALHCESLRPEVYHQLMGPLRLERVLPKYEQMLAAFPGQVAISIPVSRLNRDELGPLRAWFLERGAARVTFDPLSSRCARDRSLFDSLALDPKPIRCGPDVLDDLIIDCDGLVTTCCQDFERLEPIGHFAGSSLAALLADPRRLAMRRRFAEQRHGEMPTCTRCFGDVRNGRAMKAALAAVA